MLTQTFGDEIIDYLNTFADPFSSPIASTKHAASCFRRIWNRGLMCEQEQFYVLFLDSAHNVINWKCLFTGGTLYCNIDYRIILTHALKAGAYGIMVAHNHPNQSLEPSQADLDATHGLVKACEMVGLKLLDAQILTSDAYYSFVNHGLLNKEES